MDVSSKKITPHVVMIKKDYFYIRDLTKDVKGQLNEKGYQIGINKKLPYFLIKNEDEISIINDLIDLGVAFALDYKDLCGGPGELVRFFAAQGKVRKDFNVCYWSKEGLVVELNTK